MKNKKPIKRKFSLSLFSLLFLILIFFFYPGQNIYETSFKIGKPQIANVSAVLPTPAAYPVNQTGFLPPELSSKGILVVDLASQVVIYQKNPETRLAPASITKLMTALVGLEIYKQDQVLEVRTYINEGKVMGLLPGEKITFENLLYMSLVDSDNDAAYAIAENDPGGMSNFIVKMNKKAKNLHMENTNFTNPVGFEDNNHYTTAQDLSRLVSVAISNPEIARIVGITEITLPNGNFTKFYHLTNVNQLLGKVPGVLGVKTGWTEEAGECLATIVQRNNRKVMIIVLGSKDRFSETETLINWVFNNFTWEDFAPPKPD